jgi:MFS family permease
MPAPIPTPTFIVQNARWLGAGALLSFCSSFGQTFFIALSGPAIQAELGLTHGQWGGVYTAATVASALALTLSGGLADRFRVRVLAALTLAFLATAAVSMALVAGALALGLTVFALRLLGQGWCSHLAFTAMGRWFSAQRGRAVALAAMGFSLGEATLPTVFVHASAALGWRGTWLAAAGLLILCVPPLLWLLSRERTPRQIAEADSTPGMMGLHWTRAQALRHWTFWALAPGLLAPPFIGTAVFFHSAHLAQVKGWSLATVAAAFPAYSLATVLCSFAAAWAVDRFGARRLLPLYQAPLGAGVLLLALGDAPAAAFTGLALLGVTQGAAVAVLGALWPEVYGTRHIGAIRGTAVSMMVFATAVGPGLTGALLDAGVGVEAQFAVLSLWALATCFFYWAVAARIRAAMAA